MSNNITKQPKTSQQIIKDSAPTPSYKIPTPPPQKSNSSENNKS